jgi:hypothetical protein
MLAFENLMFFRITSEDNETIMPFVFDKLQFVKVTLLIIAFDEESMVIYAYDFSIT